MSTTPPPLPPATPASTATAPPVPSETNQQRRPTTKFIRSLPSKLFQYLTFRVALFFILAPLGMLYLSLKFIIIPTVASHSVAIWAEGQGMDLTVEGWSADVFNLAATAEDITVMAQGPYNEDEFLTADVLEIDLTLWGGLFKDRWIREVRVVDPVLNLERLSSGRWNWTDVGAVDFGSIQKNLDQRNLDTAITEVAGSLTIPRLTIENMALQWIEHVPASSGGGLIEERTATLFIDDIHFTASDLVGLVDQRENPSRVGIEARTGSGRISFDGQANFFSWSKGDRPTLQDGQIVTVSAEEPRWVPSLRSEIYLENVEAGALARLIPNAPIITESGSLGGTIAIDMREGRLNCVANLNFSGVTLRVNPSSPLVNARSRSIVEDLRNYQNNGQHQFSCGGVLGVEGAPFRPFQAMQTNIVQQAVRSSTLKVRAVAALEHSRYSQDPMDPELEREANAISSSIPPEVREWFEFGREVHREFGPPPALGSIGLPFGGR